MEETKDFIVNEIIKDLETKVNGLNSLLSKADENCIDEVKTIVYKTVSVLKDATQLITNSSNKLDDEELKNNVDFIKSKSNSLYKDAVDRIKKIFDERSIAGVFSFNDVIGEGINNDKLSQESISILRSWLKAEDTRK